MKEKILHWRKATREWILKCHLKKHSDQIVITHFDILTLNSIVHAQTGWDNWLTLESGEGEKK